MAAVQSAGLTEWSRFDVPGMWSLLRDVSTVEAFRQAGAWQSTYEAAQSLARRLEWYRDGLAGKWSPDGSDAAALYLGRLDELIGSAQQLADVSVANRQALVTLANAVDEARPKLQRVYEESEAMRQLGAQAKAGASVVRRQQQLHTQAIEIMESLGSAAMDSWRHYATADDYQPPQSARGVDAPVSEGNLSSTGPSIGESAGRTIARSTVATEPSLDYSSGAEPSGAWRRVVFESPSEAASLTGSLPSRAMNQADQVGRVPVSASIDVDVPASEAPDLDPVSAFSVGRSGVRSLNESVDEMRDAIGATSRALRQPGAIKDQSVGASGGIAMRRGVVNRVGGVIGSDGIGMGASGFGVGTGRPLERADRYRTYDIDDPWPVPEGGLSVIRPSPEPTDFDPGTGVIGIDR